MTSQQGCMRVMLICVCKVLVFPIFLSATGDGASPARQVLEVVLMREVVPVLVPVLVESML